MPKRWTRFTGSLVACVYFLTQCVFAHAQEGGFWAERKAAARRMTRGDALAETGFSSAGQTPSGLSTEQYQMLAQLPHAGQVAFGVPQGVSVGSGLALTPASIGPAALDLPTPSANSPTWISTLILPYGSIREIHLAKKPDAPIIIHIQDAHGIEEAQKNMAAMIQGLRESRGVNLVGLEGAAGAFDLAPYRDWPDAAVTRDIATYFLKEGKIGGPEFVGLTAPQPPVLWGIEDQDLYLGNVKALRDSLKEKPAMQKALADLKAAVAPLKDSLYSKELKEFDHHFQAYQEQKEGLAAYVRYLMGAYTGDKSRLPNLSLLLKALAAEDALDFKKVESERLQLVETLAKRLPQEKLNLLVQRSFQYRAGQMGYGDYHRFLQTLCRDNKISLGGQLNDYIAYVLLAEKIDRNALLDELTRLERDAQDRLTLTPEQKRLVAVGRRLALLDKLAVQAMTPEDWAAYQGQRQDILNIVSDVNGLGGRTSVLLSAEFLTPFEDFCRNAVGRNAAFIGGLTEQMKKQNASAAVLVAGGFHSDGLARLMREKDLSYVVVTPKITEVPKDNNYLDVFARDPLPLEKLFSGQKIFLKNAIGLANGVLPTSPGDGGMVKRDLITEEEAVEGQKSGEAPEEIEKDTERRAQEADAPMGVKASKPNANTLRLTIDTDRDGTDDIVRVATTPGLEASDSKGMTSVGTREVAGVILLTGEAKQSALQRGWASFSRYLRARHAEKTSRDVPSKNLKKPSNSGSENVMTGWGLGWLFKLLPRFTAWFAAPAVENSIVAGPVYFFLSLGSLGYPLALLWVIGASFFMRWTHKKVFVRLGQDRPAGVPEGATSHVFADGSEAFSRDGQWYLRRDAKSEERREILFRFLGMGLAAMAFPAIGHLTGHFESIRISVQTIQKLALVGIGAGALWHVWENFQRMDKGKALLVGGADDEKTLRDEVLARVADFLRKEAEENPVRRSFVYGFTEMNVQLEDVRQKAEASDWPAVQYSLQQAYVKFQGEAVELGIEADEMERIREPMNALLIRVTSFVLSRAPLETREEKIKAARLWMKLGEIQEKRNPFGAEAAFRRGIDLLRHEEWAIQSKDRLFLSTISRLTSSLARMTRTEEAQEAYWKNVYQAEVFINVKEPMTTLSVLDVKIAEGRRLVGYFEGVVGSDTRLTKVLEDLRTRLVGLEDFRRDRFIGPLEDVTREFERRRSVEDLANLLQWLQDQLAAQRVGSPTATGSFLNARIEEVQGLKEKVFQLFLAMTEAQGERNFIEAYRLGREILSIDPGHSYAKESVARLKELSDRQEKGNEARQRIFEREEAFVDSHSPEEIFRRLEDYIASGQDAGVDALLTRFLASPRFVGLSLDQIMAVEVYSRYIQQNRLTETRTLVRNVEARIRSALADRAMEEAGVPEVKKASARPILLDHYNAAPWELTELLGRRSVPGASNVAAAFGRLKYALEEGVERHAFRLNRDREANVSGPRSATVIVRDALAGSAEFQEWFKVEGLQGRLTLVEKMAVVERYLESHPLSGEAGVLQEADLRLAIARVHFKDRFDFDLDVPWEGSDRKGMTGFNGKALTLIRPEEVNRLLKHLVIVDRELDKIPYTFTGSNKEVKGFRIVASGRAYYKARKSSGDGEELTDSHILLSIPLSKGMTEDPDNPSLEDWTVLDYVNTLCHELGHGVAGAYMGFPFPYDANRLLIWLEKHRHTLPPARAVLLEKMSDDPALRTSLDADGLFYEAISLAYERRRTQYEAARSRIVKDVARHSLAELSQGSISKEDGPLTGEEAQEVESFKAGTHANDEYGYIQQLLNGNPGLAEELAQMPGVKTFLRNWAFKLSSQVSAEMGDLGDKNEFIGNMAYDYIFRVPLKDRKFKWADMQRKNADEFIAEYSRAFMRFPEEFKSKDAEVYELFQIMYEGPRLSRGEFDEWTKEGGAGSMAPDSSAPARTRATHGGMIAKGRVLMPKAVALAGMALWGGAGLLMGGPVMLFLAAGAMMGLTLRLGLDNNSAWAEQAVDFMTAVFFMAGHGERLELFTQAGRSRWAERHLPAARERFRAEAARRAAQSGLSAEWAAQWVERRVEEERKSLLEAAGRWRRAELRLRRRFGGPFGRALGYAAHVSLHSWHNLGHYFDKFGIRLPGAPLHPARATTPSTSFTPEDVPAAMETLAANTALKGEMASLTAKSENTPLKRISTVKPSFLAAEPEGKTEDKTLAAFMELKAGWDPRGDSSLRSHIREKVQALAGLIGRYQGNSALTLLLDIGKKGPVDALFESERKALTASGWARDEFDAFMALAGGIKKTGGRLEEKDLAAALSRIERAEQRLLALAASDKDALAAEAAAYEGKSRALASVLQNLKGFGLPEQLIRELGFEEDSALFNESSAKGLLTEAERAGLAWNLLKDIDKWDAKTMTTELEGVFEGIADVIHAPSSWKPQPLSDVVGRGMIRSKMKFSGQRSSAYRRFVSQFMRSEGTPDFLGKVEDFANLPLTISLVKVGLPGIVAWAGRIHEFEERAAAEKQRLEKEAALESDRTDFATRKSGWNPLGDISLQDHVRNRANRGMDPARLERILALAAADPESRAQVDRTRAVAEKKVAEAILAEARNLKGQGIPENMIKALGFEEDSLVLPAETAEEIHSYASAASLAWRLTRSFNSEKALDQVENDLKTIINQLHEIIGNPRYKGGSLTQFIMTGIKESGLIVDRSHRPVYVNIVSDILKKNGLQENLSLDDPSVQLGVSGAQEDLFSVFSFAAIILSEQAKTPAAPQTTPTAPRVPVAPTERKPEPAAVPVKAAPASGWDAEAKAEMLGKIQAYVSAKKPLTILTGVNNFIIKYVFQELTPQPGSRELKAARQVEIDGYPGLGEFFREHRKLLKAALEKDKANPTTDPLTILESEKALEAFQEAVFKRRRESSSSAEGKFLDNYMLSMLVHMGGKYFADIKVRREVAHLRDSLSGEVSPESAMEILRKGRWLVGSDLFMEVLLRKKVMNGNEMETVLDDDAVQAMRQIYRKLCASVTGFTQRWERRPWDKMNPPVQGALLAIRGPDGADRLAIFQGISKDGEIQVLAETTMLPWAGRGLLAQEAQGLQVLVQAAVSSNTGFGTTALRSFVGGRALAESVFFPLLEFVRQSEANVAEAVAGVLSRHGVEAAHLLSPDHWPALLKKAGLEGFQVELYEALRGVLAKSGLLRATPPVDPALDQEVRELLEEFGKLDPRIKSRRLVYSVEEDAAMVDPTAMTIPLPRLERNKGDLRKFMAQYVLHESLEGRLGPDFHNGLIELGFDEGGSQTAEQLTHLAREMLAAADQAGTKLNDRGAFLKALAERFEVTGDRALLRALLLLLSPKAQPVGWDVRITVASVSGTTGMAGDFLNLVPEGQKILDQALGYAKGLNMDLPNLMEALFQGAMVGASLPDLETGQGEVLDLSPLLRPRPGEGNDLKVVKHLERVLSAVEARGEARGLLLGAAGRESEEAVLSTRRQLTARFPGLAKSGVVWVGLPVEGKVMKLRRAAQSAKDAGMSSIKIVTPLLKGEVDLKDMPDGMPEAQYEHMSIGEFFDRALRWMAAVLANA